MIHKTEVVTYYSDVTGQQVEQVTSVAVKKGNQLYIIDVDADRVDEELSQITVKEVLDKGRVEQARRSPARNKRAELHAKARVWARANGIHVASRGLVPEDILEQYRQAEVEAEQQDAEQVQTEHAE